MKEIVVRVSDSVCKAHNRDPEATALIEAAKTFGTVESFEQAIATEKSKWAAELHRLKAAYEAEIQALKNELAAIQEKAVTQEELAVLQAIRKKAEIESAEYEAKIRARDTQLEQVIAEGESRKQQIKALYGL